MLAAVWPNGHDLATLSTPELVDGRLLPSILPFPPDRYHAMTGWFNLPKWAGGESSNRQAEDFVGVEAAEFFGEAVAEAGPWEGDALGGLAGLGEFRDGEAGPEELDVAVGKGQADPADAGSRRSRDGGYGHVQGGFEPSGH